MTDARSKLDLLYQDVLGEVAEIVTRVEALKEGIPQATAALKSAASAAGEVRTALEQVPEVILKQTSAAGRDLRGQVHVAGVEIGQAVALAMEAAAQRGATALKHAVTGLPALAQQKQDEIISAWRAALADAARDEARGALAGRMARSWGSVGMSLLFAMLLGAAGLWAGADLTHHLTPWAHPLEVDSRGRAVCVRAQLYNGSWARVCGTTR